MTEFLDAGKEELNSDLEEIVSNDGRFHEALSELERFSLVGRQRDGNYQWRTNHNSSIGANCDQRRHASRTILNSVEVSDQTL